MIVTDAPLVLALDTSTVVNVGLARGDRVLARATVADQMAHAEQLMPLISRGLDVAGVRAAELGRLIVGVGPGPFTGLRVGVATRGAHSAGPGSCVESAPSTYWPRNSPERTPGVRGPTEARRRLGKLRVLSPAGVRFEATSLAA